MSFSKQIKQFNLRAIEAAGDVQRAAMTELYTSVIQDTPVDTGRARGNWQATTDAPATGTTVREDKTGQKTIASAAAKIQPGKINYLTNNLPYIDRLEYGHSKQAPAGMVRRNLQRVQAAIRRMISSTR